MYRAGLRVKTGELIIRTVADRMQNRGQKNGGRKIKPDEFLTA